MMERQARSQTASRKPFTDDQRMSANPELESTSNCVEPSSPHGESAKLTNTCAYVNMELCNWLHGLMMPETPDRYYAVCSRIICNKEHQRLDWTCLCATASVGAIPKSCFSVGAVSLSRCMVHSLISWKRKARKCLIEMGFRVVSKQCLLQMRCKALDGRLPSSLG